MRNEERLFYAAPDGGAFYKGYGSASSSGAGVAPEPTYGGSDNGSGSGASTPPTSSESGSGSASGVDLDGSTRKQRPR